MSAPASSDAKVRREKRKTPRGRARRWYAVLRRGGRFHAPATSTCSSISLPRCLSTSQLSRRDFMDTISRREFVGASLAATAGMLSTSTLELGATQTRREPSQMKVGLYTITYLGIWYRG